MSKKNCVQEREKSLAGGFYLRQEAVGGEGVMDMLNSTCIDNLNWGD